MLDRRRLHSVQIEQGSARCLWVLLGCRRPSGDTNRNHPTSVSRGGFSRFVWLAWRRTPFGLTEQDMRWCVDLIKRAYRGARGTGGIETLIQDLRYAWRGLLADPRFTLVVVLSLALGIGANTAAYTLLHATLLRALPVPEPDRLVELTVYDVEGDRSIN